MMRFFKRFLQVRFTASSMKSKQAVVFGGFDNSLYIDVSGQKYMSIQKDTFVIQIKNIPVKGKGTTFNRDNVGNITVDFDMRTGFQVDQAYLMLGGYDEVEVIAGYENGNKDAVFKGYVVYMSESMEDRGTTSSLYVVCSSALTHAPANRVSETISAGTSIYSLLHWLCKKNQINAKIDDRLKLKFLTEDMSFDGSFLDAIYTITKIDRTIGVNVDKTEGYDVHFWDMVNTDKRQLTLTNDRILFANGFPTITQEGLRFTTLPTFNFCPGDVVKIDDTSIIQMPLTSYSQFMSTPNLAQFYDANGEYVIFEISYHLQNRGDAFELNVLGKAKTLYKNIVGATMNEQ